ncbi:MAG: flagellar biosynthetic protein FliR [Acetobacteraceae bacterium]|nr:flagellar biosynthetic protein FliR [Acetobacteraceae bacterium]
MTADDQALLAGLPGWAFAFVLVLSRVAAAFMLLPALGEAELPPMVRAGLALAFTVVLLPVVAPLLPPVPANGLAALLAVAGETVAGLWLGWLARLLMLALPMAGQMMAGVIGLANVLQPDAVMGPQGSALARLFALAAPVAILAAGLHALPLAALEGSYHVLPPLGATLPPGEAARSIVAAVSDSFALALRLAGPFVLAAIVWNLALGLLSRLVPQLQIYFAALPGQIMGGILLLGLLSGAVLAAWLDALRSGYAALPGL